MNFKHSTNTGTVEISIDTDQQTGPKFVPQNFIPILELSHSNAPFENLLEVELLSYIIVVEKVCMKSQVNHLNDILIFGKDIKYFAVFCFS